ncbi:MAG: DNA-directed RNA polymerase subunit omega [Candidatus Omnitrophota bacterium]|nr:MAG: DNA-directed RNA polymerase subunit omega [Candidatus Omnitrophota bacterium]
MEDKNIPLEKLLDATSGSIYKLTVLVAKRALTLADGEKPLVEKPGEKALQNAIREIAEGKVKEKE